MPVKADRKIGDVVRYEYGATALMVICNIQKDHGRVGQTYYHGITYYGSVIGSYGDTLKSAIKLEVRRFKTDNHLHRLDWGRVREALALIPVKIKPAAPSYPPEYCTRCGGLYYACPHP